VRGLWGLALAAL
jgi:sterol desaturase/sphingolipid hydroxylase (fatty acid hydroxylase superfamily)